MGRQMLLLLALANMEAAEKRLSLREAVQTAIENNPEIVAERAVREGASAAITAAQGAFDPIVGLRGGWRKSRMPAASILDGVNGRLEERSWVQGMRLWQRLPWRGIEVESSIENQRLQTNNPFVSLNPYYQLVERSSVKIPLWRFGKTDQVRTELKVRRKEAGAASKDFEMRVVALVHRVETAYWNLMAASEAEQWARALESTAESAMESTARLIREGEMADSELAGARGQLQRAREQRASAEGRRREAAAQLKGLLASSATDPVWGQELVTAEDMAGVEPGHHIELRKMALAGHPEIRALELRMEAQKAQRELAETAAAPQVDLQFSQTRQGLAGRAVPQESFFPGVSFDAPPQLIGGLGRVGTQVWRNRYPTYEVGLNIEFPWRNRAAEGALAQQRIAEKRLSAQRRQLEIQIVSGIEQAWARWEAARKRIESAKGAEEDSKQRLESELRLYREGQGNNLGVNSRQNELTESRQLLVMARQDQNQAAADLRQISATSLTYFGIRVE